MVGVDIMVRISEFQVKDVVNISDGRKLGNIGDIDINLKSGKIEAIIIIGSGRVLGLFGKEEEVIIPWKNILKIGEDVILVRYKDVAEIQYIE
jgi:YlmC/YmxH family sporulation protein